MKRAYRPLVVGLLALGLLLALAESRIPMREAGHVIKPATARADAEFPTPAVSEAPPRPEPLPMFPLPWAEFAIVTPTVVELLPTKKAERPEWV